jgi:hypothetical protein
MRDRRGVLSALIIGGVVSAGCARATHRIEPRRVSPPEWSAVVDCVTLAARASGKEVVVSEFALSIPANVKGIWRSEDIVFMWGPSHTVQSKINVRDSRQGNRVPMEGATQETRRLRQQVDQQWLTAYPVAVRADTPARDARRAETD